MRATSREGMMNSSAESYGLGTKRTTYVLVITFRVAIEEPLDGGEDVEEQDHAYGPFESVKAATKFAKDKDYIGQPEYVCHEVIPLNLVE